MTSSLVGSEMCIRDSLMRHNSTGRLWSQQCSTHEEEDRITCTISPVSYTHLTLPTICSV
eukprot:3244074-Prorocentrum_lima.AAC.1